MMAAAAEDQFMKYARFQHGQDTAYGIVDGNVVRQITGDLFGARQETWVSYALDEVKLLVPVTPSKVLAVGLNYRSHLGGRPMPEEPAIFLKPPSCLVPTGADIVLPSGSADVHYEGEMVVVIGKRARNVSPDEALGHVLGVTCGNDVSARDWQKNDLQWWRAKGSDTFGPCGPFIATGLDYDNLHLQLRENGDVKQEQRTSDLIHGVAATVSFISRAMTLEPGDLIYTGTPGKTTALKPGDVVEVELEGVGVLTNRVVAGA
jgi:2-keto-4-pentenoate hydratase/2-oxohepta-3-ene-1,7-dioic acid hydratase in catechol pathway